MKASDIIWGGDHKVIVSLQNPIPDLSAGDEVKIEYDYIKNSFMLIFEENETQITPINKAFENQLDLIKDGKSFYNTVLSIDEDGCFIRLRIFEEIVELGIFATLRIAINDDIVKQLGDNEQSNPLNTLQERFIYIDPKTGKQMIFVKGYGKQKDSFSLLSKRNRLNIVKDGDSFVAESYKGYNSGYADFDSVFILKGKIEFVDTTRDAKISAELNRNMEKISAGGNYFEIWDTYLNLEKISLLQHARDIGSVQYKSFSCVPTSEGYKYTFILADGGCPDFLQDEILDAYIEDVVNSDRITPDSISSLKTTKVGAFLRVNENECIVIDNDSDTINNHIPAKGFLFLSLTGDEIRMKRCERAKTLITENKAEIDYLYKIIGDGTIIHNEIRNNNPITNKLKSLPEFKNRDFNEEQIQAIDNAINTSDISLILGPPGTGKTFVIKAIVARFEELFKKENPNDSPDILISSFQHVAVDNAAKGMENNGLPPNRTGGKKGINSNISSYISEWKKNKTKELSDRLAKDAVIKDDSIEDLSNQIFSWEKKGRNVTDGLTILRERVNNNIINLSDELKTEAYNLLTVADNIEKKSVIKSLQEEEVKERNQILLSQRLEDKEFINDGVKQARRLRTAIEIEDLFPDVDSSIVRDVIRTEGQDNEVFTKYVETVKALKEKYVTGSINNLEDKIDIQHEIELLLRRIAGELRREKIESKKDAMTAETIILKEYLDLIQDDNEILRIVQNYSSINAATCQQAMNIKDGSIEKKYDLVIIDEAARANPLDLMIPMSMGKKVILVGDHKQLPHMLSPEVVKEYKKEGKEDQMGILKESLFERLFNSFEKNEIRKRTVRLSQQYRMHSLIGNFASELFYDGLLKSDYVDDNLKQANIGMYHDKPLVFLDLPLDEFGAEKPDISKSRESEANYILKEVVKVLNKNPDKSVGIITFYKKQDVIMKEFKSNYLTGDQQTCVEIGTIDAFQGKEFDIVFLSCVRANNSSEDDLHKKIGHLNDRNRLCVAFTRARQLLVTVGDSKTMSIIPEMNKLLEICKKGESGYYELIKK